MSRADVDDSTLAFPEPGEEGLGGREEPDHVDVHQLLDLGRRHEFQGSVEREARVVDQTEESRRCSVGDGPDRGCDRVVVGDVEKY
jgi:hypothetical protein